MAVEGSAPDPGDPGPGYTARHLLVLEGLEAVRKRPGMYVGSTDGRGLMHCLWEIVDNGVDEALAGHCSRIEVVLRADGAVEVRDDGRGIPVDPEPRTGLTGVEVVMTKLHAGGKFGGAPYLASGGLHGVGASVVNALAARLDVEVDRDGRSHALSFRRGVPGVFAGDGPDSEFEPRSGLRVLRRVAKRVTGTRVRFWPDRQIFLRDAEFSADELATRARQSAFLVPGLALTVRDERGPEVDEQDFRADGGITDFCDFLAPDEPVAGTWRLHGSGSFTETVPVLDGDGHMDPQEVQRELSVDVALRWGSGYDTAVRSFVNVIATPHGGTHASGFERALVKTVGEQLRAAKLLKANEGGIVKDDVLEGLTAIVTVRLPEPQFEGQTKETLGTPAASRIVNHVVSTELRRVLSSSKRAEKAQARAMLDKVVSAARARVAARTQRENQRRKNVLESSSLPAKLVDCRSDDVDRNELFVVEGDSAMGCFAGDTEVALVEGGSLTFAELARDWQQGRSHFGYSTDDRGNVVVVPLQEPRVTRRNAPLVEVVLYDGSTLRCTPDHVFLLRDGSYRPAAALSSGDSLMPLYRRLTETGEAPGPGYEMAWANGRMRWEHTHHLADAWSLRTGAASKEDGPVRHHLDFDKRNNDSRPGLREECSAAARRQWADPILREWRRQKTREQWQAPEARSRHSDAVRSWHAEHTEFGEEHSARIRALHAHQPGYTEASQEGLQRWRERTSSAEKSKLVRDGQRRAALERLARALRAGEGETCAVYERLRLQEAPTSASYRTLLRQFDGDEHRLHEAARNLNHQVVEVRNLGEHADVYDLTVDKHHNFALEAGVFVHNSAKSARSSEFQALLPIRGKILNVQKSSVSDMLRNAECSSIIQVLGAGSGRTFDPDAVRYGKVVIMVDADVDGAHIRCLLLTLFHRQMRPLLAAGRVFAAVPPLHRIETVGSGKKKGTYHYTYSEAEMQRVVADLQRKGTRIREPIQRYKGLGEMDADQLAETTMDPRHRVLRRIRVEDAKAADEVFELLMGNTVAPRREFIARGAAELDPARIDT